MATKKIDPATDSNKDPILDLSKGEIIQNAQDPVAPDSNINVDLGNGISVQLSATPKEDLPTDAPVLSPEEIEKVLQANINADQAFNAALADNDARVKFEESIQTMTNDELNATFAYTMPEAIGILRSVIEASKSLHKDKMNDLLNKIEKTSEL